MRRRRRQVPDLDRDILLLTMAVRELEAAEAALQVRLGQAREALQDLIAQRWLDFYVTPSTLHPRRPKTPIALVNAGGKWPTL